MLLLQLGTMINFENVTLGECDEFKIGMQVRFEEVYNPYKLYALRREFSIWKVVKWENNGVIRQRELVFKQGYKVS